MDRFESLLHDDPVLYETLLSKYDKSAEFICTKQ